MYTYVILFDNYIKATNSAVLMVFHVEHIEALRRMGQQAYE